MKFVAFLLLCGMALGLSFLTNANETIFEEFGRWVVGLLALFLWFCAVTWLLVKIEM